MKSLITFSFLALALSAASQTDSTRSFTNPSPHQLYEPKWRNDGTEKKVKNIILIIGDGTGLAQWYAGYTSNHGALNVFNMHYSGLSKTSSYSDYITDSAPGATAFSSGKKTNNRAVGVDHTGNKLILLPELIRKKKMLTGVITSGDLRDATPASFYAHQSERSKYREILQDFLKDPIDLLIGSANDLSIDSLNTSNGSKFSFLSSITQLPSVLTKHVLVAERKAGLPAAAGRDNWAVQSFTKSLDLLSQNQDGFFLMYEGAQVDHGGHANKLPWLVTELLDMDKVIGKAMEFADSNGETLVIVSADHETGGLSLLGGDYTKGFVTGQFSTGHHTAVPVPVYAYGPYAQLFTGVYENTEIFYKMLKALKLK